MKIRSRGKKKERKKKVVLKDEPKPRGALVTLQRGGYGGGAGGEIVF